MNIAELIEWIKNYNAPGENLEQFMKDFKAGTG